MVPVPLGRLLKLLLLTSAAPHGAGGGHTTPQIRAAWRVSSPRAAALGEADPALQLRHAPQQLRVVEVHVVGEVRAHGRLQVPESAVQGGSPHAEQNRGDAQQDQ